MRFGPIPLADAEGAILGHNIVDDDGRRVLRKGGALSASDLERLAELGRQVVYAARLDPGDILEDDAAQRITLASVDATALRFSRPATGRVNVFAQCHGVVSVDAQRLFELNSLPGVTLATLFDNSVAHSGQMVSTTKILPYALPAATVERAEQLSSEGPVVSLQRLAERRVGLLVCGSPGNRERLLHGFEAALRQRVEDLGSTLACAHFEELPPGRGASVLAKALTRLLDQTRPDLLLLAGETAIQDRHDLIPEAVELAGGEVVVFGAPVDPGNLLMLGRIGDTPVLGTPGCARSPKRNIVDIVLPQLLIDRMPTVEEILHMGHGGLLEDVPERPLPRSRLD